MGDVGAGPGSRTLSPHEAVAPPAPRRGVVLTAVLAASIAACSVSVKQASTTTSSTPGSTAPATSSPTTNGSGTGSSTVAWHDCGGGFQCGTHTVPLDWFHPGAGTISLALIRRPAGNPSRRVGSLFFNPGGPGEPGVSFLRDLAGSDSTLPKTLTDRFDLVSWDPRGTGNSAGIRCIPASEQQQAAPSTGRGCGRCRIRRRRQRRRGRPVHRPPPEPRPPRPEGRRPAGCDR